MKNVISNNLKLSFASALCLMSSHVFAGEKIDEILDTKADGSVMIDVLSGDVTINVWDKNQVSVKGELSDDAEGYTFEVDGNGDTYFNVKMPNKNWGNWNNDDGSTLTIMIPKTNDIRFEGVNVNIDVQNVEGESRINTVNGNIRANKLNKRVTLETVNGEIKSTDLNGKIKLNTVNGEVNDKNSQGELEIETVNGEIKTNTSATEIGINSVNGQVTVIAKIVKEMEVSMVNGEFEGTLELSKTGRFSFSSIGGETRLNFLGDVSADFDIEAHAGGDITNKLSEHKAKEAKYGPSESLKFRLGEGTADVEIDTVNGNVVLKKK